ncbi:MAG: hypothetical protein VKS61_01460 [Candidatus Sericytochromatia bacterium]|nr:hypothetical protein [Candidatus Sericytochromatia bacterium]
MRGAGALRALLGAGLVWLAVAGPAPASGGSTGGLGGGWLLERGDVPGMPEAWRPALHALGAMRRPGQPPAERPALAVGATWLARTIPWAQLRAGGLRLVATDLRHRSEVAACLDLGVDGIGGDRPDLLVAALAGLDGDGDGRGGDWLDASGAPDPGRLEVRGFAGARGVRPEATLPGVEAALDVGVTALELPVRTTRDGRVVLSLDATVRPGKHRSLPGAPALGGGLMAEGPAIATLSLGDLRGRYDRAVRLAGQPAQSLDPEASPVALAFSRKQGWPSPHAYASLEEVFGFLRAYADHHAAGPGRLLPEGPRRARAAGRVRVVVAVPAGPGGATAGRAALEAARRAGMLERLTLSASGPDTLVRLHSEAPRVAVELVLP